MAIKIYIDQGHNPESPNAGAEGNGLREQDITYRVGVALYELLSENPNFTARLRTKRARVCLLPHVEDNIGNIGLYCAVGYGKFFAKRPNGGKITARKSHIHRDRR